MIILKLFSIVIFLKKLYGTCGKSVFVYANKENLQEEYALKLFYVNDKLKFDFDREFGFKIAEKNSPFIIKYFCETAMNLTKELVDLLSNYYDLNKINFTGLIDMSVVMNKTFKLPSYTTGRKFPYPPYSGILMEFGNGTSVGKMYSSPQNMPEERLIKIFYGIISSLQIFHSIGIVHGDIKGNNYILVKDDIVKLSMYNIIIIIYYNSYY
jgi:serine/threonine protein kinase